MERAKTGLSEEQKRKMAQARRAKTVCHKCGLMGHFMNECTAVVMPGQRADHMLNKIRREAGLYNIAEDLLTTKANMTLAQVYNEVPQQRKNLHEALKSGAIPQ